jgi:hypothetical protein
MTGSAEDKSETITPEWFAAIHHQGNGPNGEGHAPGRRVVGAS